MHTDVNMAVGLKNIQPLLLQVTKNNMKMLIKVETFFTSMSKLRDSFSILWGKMS